MLAAGKVRSLAGTSSVCPQGLDTPGLLDERSPIAQLYAMISHWRDTSEVPSLWTCLAPEVEYV